MTKDKYVISKTKRYPYYILMFAILIWFVAMEIFGTNERMIDMSADSLIYSGSFTWQKPDGSAESVDVPGHYSIPAGETMILTTTLPDDYNAHVIAFRSSLQDVNAILTANCEPNTAPKIPDYLARIQPAVIYSAIPLLPMQGKNSASN